MDRLTDFRKNRPVLSTWIPEEYELNKTYADDRVLFSEYLKLLRSEIRNDTLKKLEELGN